ncbi:MAG: type IV pilus biogenesis/stability protein PilW [Gammaproteobacteria bacterium]
MNYRFAVLLSSCLTLAACATIQKDQDAELDRAEESPATVYTNLGMEYLKRGQDEIALKNFETAIKKDPGNSEAHQAIAMLYQKLKQNDRVEYHLKQAVSLRSTNASAQNDYGNFLCEQGNFAEADQHFQKAIDTPLYENPWLAMANKGICEKRAGNMEEAEKDLRTALEKQPKWGPALLAMAEISLDTDKALNARAFIQRYLSDNPPSAEALLLGVKIERALGDTAAANKYKSQLESQFPDSDEAKSLSE